MAEGNVGLKRKLLAIQAGLKAPKKQYNKFGNYKFRSCEDILEAAKPLLLEQGASLTIHDEIHHDGERYYVKAVATLEDCDDIGSVTVEAYAREPVEKKGMDESQITGTASSYARKYALNGLFLIDDTKDADTDENKEERDAKAREQANAKSREQRKPDDGKGEQKPKEEAGHGKEALMRMLGKRHMIPADVGIKDIDSLDDERYAAAVSLVASMDKTPMSKQQADDLAEMCRMAGEEWKEEYGKYSVSGYHKMTYALGEKITRKGEAA